MVTLPMEASLSPSREYLIEKMLPAPAEVSGAGKGQVLFPQGTHCLCLHCCLFTPSKYHPQLVINQGQQVLVCARVYMWVQLTLHIDFA